MKKIIFIIFLVAVLSGCATAKVVQGIGSDISAGRETAETVSGSDWFDMAMEWLDIAAGAVIDTALLGGF